MRLRRPYGGNIKCRIADFQTPQERAEADAIQAEQQELVRLDRAAQAAAADNAPALELGVKADRTELKRRAADSNARAEDLCDRILSHYIADLQRNPKDCKRQLFKDCRQTLGSITREDIATASNAADWLDLEDGELPPRNTGNWAWQFITDTISGYRRAAIALGIDPHEIDLMAARRHKDLTGVDRKLSYLPAGPAEDALYCMYEKKSTYQGEVLDPEKGEKVPALVVSAFRDGKGEPKASLAFKGKNTPLSTAAFQMLRTMQAFALDQGTRDPYAISRTEFVFDARTLAANRGITEPTAADLDYFKGELWKKAQEIASGQLELPPEEGEKDGAIFPYLRHAKPVRGGVQMAFNEDYLAAALKAPQTLADLQAENRIGERHAYAYRIFLHLERHYYNYRNQGAHTAGRLRVSFLLERADFKNKTPADLGKNSRHWRQRIKGAFERELDYLTESTADRPACLESWYYCHTGGRPVLPEELERISFEDWAALNVQAVMAAPLPEETKRRIEEKAAAARQAKAAAKADGKAKQKGKRKGKGKGTQTAPAAAAEPKAERNRTPAAQAEPEEPKTYIDGAGIAAAMRAGIEAAASAAAEPAPAPAPKQAPQAEPEEPKKNLARLAVYGVRDLQKWRKRLPELRADLAAEKDPQRRTLLEGEIDRIERQIKATEKELLDAGITPPQEGPQGG